MTTVVCRLPGCVSARLGGWGKGEGNIFFACRVGMGTCTASRPGLQFTVYSMHLHKLCHRSNARWSGPAAHWSSKLLELQPYSHIIVSPQRTVKWLQSVAIQDLSRSITLMLNGKHYTIRSSDGNKVVAKCMYHNLVFYNLKLPFFIILLMSDCQTIIHCCGHVRSGTKVSYM